jgi:hypothetical protein
VSTQAGPVVEIKRCFYSSFNSIFSCCFARCSLNIWQKVTKLLRTNAEKHKATISCLCWWKVRQIGKGWGFFTTEEFERLSPQNRNIIKRPREFRQTFRNFLLGACRMSVVEAARSKLQMIYGSSLSLTSIKHSIANSGGASDKSDNQLIITLWMDQWSIKVAFFVVATSKNSMLR